MKIKSKTLQDLLKVLSGNIVAQGIGFLTLIFLSRDLGVEEYGVFSLLLAIFTISIQISNFGISTSYVKYLSEKRDYSKEVFFTLLLGKLFFSFCILLAVFLLSSEISLFFFDSLEYVKSIQLIAFATLFHSIYTLVISHFQAKQEFKTYAYINIFHNFLKFVSIVIISFSFSQELHISYFLNAYIFAVTVVLFTLLALNYRRIFVKHSFNMVHFIEVSKLGFWIFLSSLATMIIMRLDIMMLQKMSTSLEVGYYSVAMNVAMIFPLITTSLTTTLLPKIDDYLKNNSIKKYISTIFSKAKYLLIVLVALELLSSFIIVGLFGEAYKESASIFNILIVAFTFGIIINPISLVIYTLNRAYVLTLLNWIQLPLNYFGNMLLIPLMQAEGAAISTVLLRVFGGFYILFYLLRRKNVD